jgi:hypothetical protein
MGEGRTVTDRDALAALVRDCLPGAQLDYPWDVANETADAILAAGWRAPDEVERLRGMHAAALRAIIRIETEQGDYLTDSERERIHGGGS